eukprot:g1016.t1
MGRSRRSYIDKKTSDTYQLIYRSADEASENEADRVLVQQGQSMASVPQRNRPLFRFFEGDAEELTEEQEKEIAELGLPLDGYNYLKHLRNLGSGKSELPIPEKLPKGGVFIPTENFIAPEIEERTVNATGLVVHSPALDEKEAENSMRSSTTKAFSKFVQRVKGPVIKEVEALDDLMEEYEDHNVDDGDLLDSFVLDATAMDINKTLLEEGGSSSKAAHDWTAFPEDISSDDEFIDSEERSISGKTQTKSIGRSRFSRGDMDSSSSFSERWKGTDPSDFEGRKPRTRPLEIIDETFESILEEYDSEEVGELDDQSDDGMTMEELAMQLSNRNRVKNEDFLGHPQSETNTKLPKRLGQYKLMKPKPKAVSFKNKDKKAMDATKRLATQANNGSSGREEWEHIFISVKSQTPLDCESSWSYRTQSTTYQPSVIKMPQKQKSSPKEVTTGKIELSSKSGLPRREEETYMTNDESPIESACVHQNRPREETLEEKKLRKKAIKQSQKEARAVKKETKARYRQAMVQQQKQNAAMITKNASVIQL